MTSMCLVLLAAYGIGAVPFAYLVAWRWAHVDVRREGSGNVGAANVVRTVGAVPGALVLALDIAKGAAAVWLARRAGLSDAVAAMSGVAAILGHVYPVWLGFRGGKGVATACGVFALLSPQALLVAVVVFALAVGATRYVSLASLVAAASLPVAAVALGESTSGVLAACAAMLIIVVRHRDNVRRLRAGTEPTFVDAWRDRV